MTQDRVATLRRMADEHPDDPRPLFGLALEYERAGRWPEVIETLRAYLGRTDDEGNAWGRLAAALLRTGDDEGARHAYRTGIEAALRHGHPTMAGEFEDLLEEIG
jgi:Flp pilus assembly protein TadD